MIEKKKILSHDWGVLFLLPTFWGFLLLLLFKLIYPVLSSTIGIGPYYGIIIVMFVFAIVAPIIHKLFYEVNFLKMVSLWLIFTTIGFFRLEFGSHFSQSLGVFHFLSWQMPAMVFSILYTFLYVKKQTVKLILMEPTAS